MLNLDTLRAAFPTLLASFGATVERDHFGGPDPALAAWRLDAEFSHPAGVGVVSAWQQGGCCDIDFVAVDSAKGVFFHGEFASDSDLLEFVTATLRPLLDPPAPAITRSA